MGEPTPAPPWMPDAPLAVPEAGERETSTRAALRNPRHRRRRRTPGHDLGRTGAVALVIAPIAREYGMDHFIATVILAGILHGRRSSHQRHRKAPRAHARHRT